MAGTFSKEMKQRNRMKWYEPFNLSVPLAIIVACMTIGYVQGTRHAREMIVKHPALAKDKQWKAMVVTRFIGGNLIIGGPFAFVLFFSLMPLNRKHYGPRSQNNTQDGIRQPVDGAPKPSA